MKRIQAALTSPIQATLVGFLHYDLCSVPYLVISRLNAKTWNCHGFGNYWPLQNSLTQQCMLWVMQKTNCISSGFTKCRRGDRGHTVIATVISLLCVRSLRRILNLLFIAVKYWNLASSSHLACYKSTQ